MRILRGFRHPVHRYGPLTWVAKYSWKHWLTIFLLAPLLIGALLSLFHAALAGSLDISTIFKQSIDNALFLVDAPFLTTTAPPTELPSDWITSIHVYLMGISKLAISAVILGVVVFKLLVVSDVFVARRHISIANANTLTGTRWQMNIRLYNATKLEVVQITFAAHLRVPQFQPNGSAHVVPNKQITIDQGREHWPIAIPFVPYTVKITLQDNDVDESGSRPRLVSIHGVPLRPVSGHTFFVLSLTAQAPEFGSTISETHWFNLSAKNPDYAFSPFEDIHVIPGSVAKRAGGNPRSWKGWSRFERG